MPFPMDVLNELVAMRDSLSSSWTRDYKEYTTLMDASGHREHANWRKHAPLENVVDIAHLDGGLMATNYALFMVNEVLDRFFPQVNDPDDTKKMMSQESVDKEIASRKESEVDNAWAEHKEIEWEKYNA